MSNKEPDVLTEQERVLSQMHADLVGTGVSTSAAADTVEALALVSGVTLDPAFVRHLRQ